MKNRTLKLLTTTLLTALLLTIAAPNALAHTNLKDATPGPGDHVSGDITTLTLTFETKIIEINITLTTPTGDKLPTTKTRKTDTTWVFELKQLEEEGDYTVNYTYKAEDKDEQKSVYTFKYGETNQPINNELAAAPLIVMLILILAPIVLVIIMTSSSRTPNKKIFLNDSGIKLNTNHEETTESNVTPKTNTKAKTTETKKNEKPKLEKTWKPPNQANRRNYKKIYTRIKNSKLIKKQQKNPRAKPDNKAIEATKTVLYEIETYELFRTPMNWSETREALETRKFYDADGDVRIPKQILDTVDEELYNRYIIGQTAKKDEQTITFKIPARAQFYTENPLNIEDILKQY